MNYFNSKTINLMMYLDELHLYLNLELIFFIDFHYIHIIVNFYIKFIPIRILIVDLILFIMLILKIILYCLL